MDDRVLESWEFYGPLFQEILDYLEIPWLDYDELQRRYNFHRHLSNQDLYQAQYKYIQEIFSEKSGYQLQCRMMNINGVRDVISAANTISAPLSPDQTHWVICPNGISEEDEYFYIIVAYFVLAGIIRFLVIPVRQDPRTFLLPASDSELILSDLEIIQRWISNTNRIATKDEDILFSLEAEKDMISYSPTVFLRDIVVSLSPEYCDRSQYSETFHDLYRNLASLPYAGYNYILEQEEKIKSLSEREIDFLQIYALHSKTLYGRALLIVLMCVKLPTTAFLNYLLVILHKEHQEYKGLRPPYFDYLPVLENRLLEIIHGFLFRRFRKLEEPPDFIVNKLTSLANSIELSVRDEATPLAIIGFFERFVTQDNVKMADFFAHAARYFGENTCEENFAKYRLTPDAFIIYSVFYSNKAVGINMIKIDTVFLRIPCLTTFNSVIESLLAHPNFSKERSLRIFVTEIIAANQWPFDKFFPILVNQIEFLTLILKHLNLVLPKIIREENIILLFDELSNSYPTNQEFLMNYLNKFLLEFLDNASHSQIYKIVNGKYGNGLLSTVLKDNADILTKQKDNLLQCTGRIINNVIRQNLLQKYGVNSPSRQNFQLSFTQSSYSRVTIKEEISLQNNGDITDRGFYGTIEKIHDIVVKTVGDDYRYSYFTELDRAGKLSLYPKTDNVIVTKGFDTYRQKIYVEAGVRPLPGVKSPVQNPDEMQRRRRYIYDMLRGIYSCHSQGIYHLDLKERNVITLPEMNDKIKAVLIDFGISEFTGNMWNIPTQSSVKLTDIYRPPEIDIIRRNIPYDYSAVDIWTAAVIMWVLLSPEAKHPYLPTLTFGNPPVQFVYYPSGNDLCIRIDDGKENLEENEYCIQFFVDRAFKTNVSAIYGTPKIYTISSDSKLPLSDFPPDRFDKNISMLDPNIIEQLGQPTYTLLRKMMAIKFWERPTIEEVLRDDFFHDLASDTSITSLATLRTDLHWRLGGMYQYQELERQTRYLEKMTEKIYMRKSFRNLTEWKNEIEQLAQSHSLTIPPFVSRTREERMKIIHEIYPLRCLLSIFPSSEYMGEAMMTIFDDHVWYQFLYLYAITNVPLQYDNEIVAFYYAFIEIVNNFEGQIFFDMTNIYQFDRMIPRSLMTPLPAPFDISRNIPRKQINFYQACMANACHQVYTYISPLDFLCEYMNYDDFCRHYDSIIKYLNSLFVDGIFQKYNSGLIAMTIFDYLTTIDTALQQKNLYDQSVQFNTRYLEEVRIEISALIALI